MNGDWWSLHVTQIHDILDRCWRQLYAGTRRWRSEPVIISARINLNACQARPWLNQAHANHSKGPFNLFIILEAPHSCFLLVVRHPPRRLSSGLFHLSFLLILVEMRFDVPLVSSVLFGATASAAYVPWVHRTSDNSEDSHIPSYAPSPAEEQSWPHPAHAGRPGHPYGPPSGSSASSAAGSIGTPANKQKINPVNFSRLYY